MGGAVTALRVLSLNGENMSDLVPASGAPSERDASRSRLLAALITSINPDIVGLVEAPASQERTQRFVTDHLGGAYQAWSGEKRGVLGLSVLVRASLGITAGTRSKAQSRADFGIGQFDSDGDGIKEVYSWANRVPLEVVLTGGPLAAPVTVIVLHAKSKGVFIPGDLYAYQQLSRANRMKQRAQAGAVRARLDDLLDADPSARVVVLGDFNDGPEYDAYSAVLGGGSFLEPVMGSVWAPDKVFTNHAGYPRERRWTIDFADRILNPLSRSRYGQPTEMRSWIDHILVSPALRGRVVAGSAKIAHRQPRVLGLPADHARMRGTDHHPPYVTLDL
jgi:endonuclease/exonuclease/phosphatase family metal-dependent hydrolase